MHACRSAFRRRNSLLNEADEADEADGANEAGGAGGAGGADEISRRSR